MKRDYEYRPQENGTAAPLVHPRQRMALHADGPCPSAEGNQR